MALPKQTPRREIIRKFRALGWDGPFSGGSHQFMRRGTHTVRIPNPHGQEQIGQPLLRQLLLESDISEEEWLKA